MSKKIDKELLNLLREAKAKFGDELLSHPDIFGIGIGYKKSKGKKTNELSLVVHVYKKLPLNKLDKSRIIPSKLSFFSKSKKSEVTVSIDVREAIPPTPEVECGECTEDLETRIRPIPGGYSISLVGVAGGTLGGWVWDRDDLQVVLISCEHVLGSTTGNDVIQPSASDGGTSPADHFADVVRAGTLDASIAAPIDGDDILPEIICSTQAVLEVAEPTIDMEIEKVGQTTGLTCGIVELIDYDSGHYGSHNDIWIDGNGSDFSSNGDSGSLYVEKEHPDGESWKRIIGIHWGGSGNDGIGHHIGEVFEDLNLGTLCEGLSEVLLESILSSDSKYYPMPIYRKSKKHNFYRGFARDFEKRISSSTISMNILKTIRKNRVEIVRFLLNSDGWRATVAALIPILRGCVITDEVLEHKFVKEDIENFKRLVKVANRISPKMKDSLSLVEKLLDQAEGKSIHSILFGS